MDQALNSQKTPHTSPLRASYGMSFVSILMKNDRVIKGQTMAADDLAVQECQGAKASATIIRYWPIFHS